MGDSPKWVKSKKRRKKREKEREKERLNDGDNNGQATHGARKLPGPIFQYVQCAYFCSNIEGGKSNPFIVTMCVFSRPQQTLIFTLE